MRILGLSNDSYSRTAVQGTSDTVAKHKLRHIQASLPLCRSSHGRIGCVSCPPRSTSLFSAWCPEERSISLHFRVCCQIKISYRSYDTMITTCLHIQAWASCLLLWRQFSPACQWPGRAFPRPLAAAPRGWSRCPSQGQRFPPHG